MLTQISVQRYFHIPIQASLAGVAGQSCDCLNFWLSVSCRLAACPLSMLIAEPVSVLWVGRAPHVLNRFGKHFRSASIAHARTVDRTAYSQKVKDCGSERLLRYPDGRVRCIRYPLITREAEAQVESIDVTVSYEEDWDPERWDDLDWSWDAHSLWQDTVSNKPAAATTAPVQPSQESLSLQKVTCMLSMMAVSSPGLWHTPWAQCSFSTAGQAHI